ncbi:MAG: histidinol dehydrogenase [bacterium]|nr:histidinol dehydrogenase [bacterium]
MLKIYNYAKGDHKKFFRDKGIDFSQHEKTVKAIIDHIRKDGDKAVREYCEKFDCTQLNKIGIKTSYPLIKRAYQKVLKKDPFFVKSIKLIIKRVENFHKNQIEKMFIFSNTKNELLGQIINPIEKVLVYVPGGQAFYPSSLIMNVIPARLAKVPEIYVTTPVKNNGAVKDELLCVLYLLGIKEIYHLGGAQALAAFSFGTKLIPRVHKIVGPGNLFVTLAKKLLIGWIDIDMLAGPSEVVIIADRSVHARNIALDILAQAEHDTIASALLITNSRDLAVKVNHSIRSLLQRYPDSPARRSLANCSIVLVENIKQAFDLSNEIAPEHLEICLPNPLKYLSMVRNAGSVFLGENTPTAVGDYFAGPNHTLPTMGTAKFYSPLGVYDFIKRTGFSYFSREQLIKSKKFISKIAEIEGLPFHSLSVMLRE